VLHELSHCIPVWAVGGKVTSFKPYPHKDEDGWHVGKMKWEGEKDVERDMFYVAPLWKGNIFSSIWILLGVLYSPFFMLAFWEWVDVANWIQGFIRERKNDGGLFREALKK